MASHTERQKTILLKIARQSIDSRLSETVRPYIDGEDDSFLNEKRGCFVTLHRRGRLRGCIGSISPQQPLVRCVEENAINAAFRDPRFDPLTSNELPDVHIEISVLTVPVDLAFRDADDLVSKLRPHTDGVIIRRGHRTATFLPQVWKQLPDGPTFLSHLCMKGGMEADCWKTPGTAVQVYQVEHFAESSG